MLKCWQDSKKGTTIEEMGRSWLIGAWRKTQKQLLPLETEEESSEERLPQVTPRLRMQAPREGHLCLATNIAQERWFVTLCGADWLHCWRHRSGPWWYCILLSRECPTRRRQKRHTISQTEKGCNYPSRNASSMEKNDIPLETRKEKVRKGVS